MFTALLDTCTLWPGLRRDFLLSLAVEGLYRPVWSSVILAELQWHEARKLTTRGTDPTEAAERAAQLVRQMGLAFGDAAVIGWEGLEGSFGLPDPDDEHVLAAALVGGAGAIVTDNIRDFPASCLPVGIEVLTPAAFAVNTVSVSPPVALAAIGKIAARSGRHGPPWTTGMVLEILTDRYGLGEAVAHLREALES